MNSSYFCPFWWAGVVSPGRLGQVCGYSGRRGLRFLLSWILEEETHMSASPSSAARLGCLCCGLNFPTQERGG